MTRPWVIAAWVLSSIGLVAMTLIIAHGFLHGHFREEGRWLIDHPWGRVTLVDLYVGFALFGAWIAYREKSVLVSAPWIIAVMLLGHWTACLYVIRALLQSRGDASRFWMGR